MIDPRAAPPLISGGDPQPSSPVLAPIAAPMGRPAQWRRLIAYVVLIYFGVLGAEYVSSGTPIPPSNPFNFMAYPPYYVMLALIATRWAPLSFRTYYIFGAFMGLAVETSITKVAWGHGDGYNYFFPVVGGFGLWELFYMVLTYHAIFSTAIPFLLCSHYMGLPRAVPMSAWIKRIVVYGLPIYTGAVWAMASKATSIAALATAVNMATVAVLIALYRRFGAQPAGFRRRGWVVLILITAVIWLVNLPRYVPEPSTLIATLLGLGLLGWMARRSARLDAANRPLPRFEPAFRWPNFLKYLVYFGVAFAIPYLALMAIGESRYLLTFPLTVLPAVIGTLYLVYNALRLFTKRIPRATTMLPQPVS
jgi:hypothetical protein